MLVVGQVGWGRPHPTKLTPDEQSTHISLRCLLSAPLLIGCDLEKLDAFTLKLLSNDEVLAVDQDSFGKQAVCVAQHTNFRVFTKDLEDGSRAVGLFNLSDDEGTITAKWAGLKISGERTIRELWTQKDLGEFSGEFSAKVPRHGVVLIRLMKNVQEVNRDTIRQGVSHRDSLAGAFMQVSGGELKSGHGYHPRGHPGCKNA